MNRPISVYTPTILRFNYDSLSSGNGCYGITGIRHGDIFRFDELCIFDSIEEIDVTGFDLPSGVTYFRGPRDILNITLPMMSQWAAWSGSTAVRYGPAGTIVPPANGQGSPAGLITGEKPTVLTAAMTNAGKLAIALESGDGENIKIRQEGMGAAVVFKGRSPAMFYSGLLLGTESGGEIGCYYLKQGQSAIYLRLESDGYAIERIAITPLPIDIERLIVARARSGRMELLANGACGRRCVLKSAEHPAEDDDASSISISLQKGVAGEAPSAEEASEESSTETELIDGIVSASLVGYISSTGETLSEASNSSIELESGYIL